jgi:hypothetical protein
MDVLKLPKVGAVGLCLLVCTLFFFSLTAMGGYEKGSARIAANGEADTKSGSDDWAMLAGTDNGLFSVDRLGNMEKLWSGGSVRKLLFIPASVDARTEGVWAILGSEGILVSSDFATWEPRNGGLPAKTIKRFQGGEKSFLQIVQEIKDVKINPANSDIMVCSTKDLVYLSRNQGRSWASLPAIPYAANGIKTVASAYLPNAQQTNDGDLVVFASHSISGVYYIQPDRPNAEWVSLSQGLEKLETTSNADEVSDFAVAIAPETGTATVYASQTFRRRIYQLDWNTKKFNLVWSDKRPFGTVDSLFSKNGSLYFLHEGTIASLDVASGSTSAPILRKQEDMVSMIRAIPATINSAVLRGDASGGGFFVLNELWLLDEAEPETTVRQHPLPQNPHAVRRSLPENSFDREGLYLPVNHAMDSHSLSPYLNRIKTSGLNMVVLDMKDDYGRLRFTPQNPEITAKGRVFRPLDIDTFLPDMKERGIYTVARIVVFKDPELAAKENGKFAVWDARNNRPWVGYRDRRRKTTEITQEERDDRLYQFFPSSDGYEIARRFYDERWVDPYSEEVWEYTAAISDELYRRGFDEIQFDYIRFPTDGENLRDARYRWRDEGMDMESAMLSFLRHVRSRVSAPISIAIYGANGWYRTSARTGQEVELLSPLVDIICPMYYPSHFEQGFLAQEPPKLRPWRIYFYGTLRTNRIARGRAIVRPYAQAFFLNVSYDKTFYGPDYVRLQIEGVRAAGPGGFIYWNNLGRYNDIPAATSASP